MSSVPLDRARALAAAHAAGKVDFRGDTLAGVTLSDLTLRGCNFASCDFRAATILMSDFTSCNFAGARFDEARISSQTRFALSDLRNTSFQKAEVQDAFANQCEMTQADFRNASLANVRFTNSDLAHVSFQRAVLRDVEVLTCYTEYADVSKAVFVSCDVDALCDASWLAADGGCSVDWLTVCRSLKAPNLERFLLKSGMPPLFITYLIDCARALDPKALFKLMQSTFISYGSPDVVFVRELRNELQKNGVRTFVFETDAVPGDKLHQLMHDGVNTYDRVLLVCSRASLDRPGVTNEVEETLAREARDGGRGYLIPITLDDYVFEWRSPVAKRVRDRVVADFRGADTDRQKFAAGIQSLLVGLRRTSGAGA